MNKKQLAALVNDIVVKTAAAHGCSEAEAQTLLGLVLRSKSADLVAATNPPAVAPAVPAPAVAADTVAA